VAAAQPSGTASCRPRWRTASENFTHCASHGNHRSCPRCQARHADEIIAELNTTIAAAVHRASPQARVIAWDWGWNNHGIAPGIIQRLPQDVWLQSVSEWSKPIERGGVRTGIGEYSLSAVGPGPRATRQWELARQAGLKTAAKVQLNNTWELSAVPYLPVLDLVAEHCANLAAQKVDGMMLSWSLGGYPSPNLRVAQRFAEQPGATVDGVLTELARELYGPGGVPHARQAWTQFSRSFAEFPYHGQVVYQGPQQQGPANLLFEKPTGYRATMVGFSYDDLDGWRGPYPAEVFARQMEKVSGGWLAGLKPLESAVAAAPGELLAQWSVVLHRSSSGVSRLRPGRAGHSCCGSSLDSACWQTGYMSASGRSTVWAIAARCFGTGRSHDTCGCSAPPRRPWDCGCSTANRCTLGWARPRAKSAVVLPMAVS
jgi:hypothetical protein